MVNRKHKHHHKSFRKMKLSFLVSLLWIAFLPSVSVSVGENLQLNDEVLGLIVFKSALVDPQRSLDSWNGDDESPCAWRFVQCNAGNRRVSEVKLDGLGLSGKIGRGLEKLQSLRMLSMSNNNLTGTINPELGMLQNLERLNLSKNALSGTIPDSISNVVNLQFLDLSQNSLSGALPDNIFTNSSSLRYLSLARNHLEGSVPRSLWRCVTLDHVNLSNNHFSGSPDFPGGIFMLSRLRTLDLSDNVLSDSVPDGIAALHNLKELVLNGNQFSGSLPADIGLCPHLIVVDLSSNLFTGTIPVSLQKLNALKFLSLSNNFLTGDLTQWDGLMLYALEHLDLSNNGLTGYLPASMGEMRSLMYLSLSNNKMSGVIPRSLADSSSLSVIRLSGNGFNGTIPESLIDTRLEELDLSRNMLMGSIPPVYGKLFETLKILDLSANNLRGSIPAEVGLLSKLRYLNLSWNQLESSIPLELGYFHNLTVLDLRNSGLIGAIPGDICDSGTLTILQLDGNSLTGPIPEGIGNCSSLYLLSLSHNNLSGPIPESMSQLSKLKILKLEVNQLSGEMPKHLARLENLLIANVSHNRLVGRLPPGGIFQTLDASAIDGNLGICSPLIKETCKLNVPKPLVLDPNAYGDMEGRKKHPNSSWNFMHRSFFSVSTIVAISAAVVIVVGVVMITLLNAIVRRRLPFVDNALESMCSSSTKSASLAVGKLILFDSTSCLDSLGARLDSVLNKSTEIGEGFFGTVYKASLGGQETMLAIKKLITAHTLQCQEDFDREARILGKVRHLNLNPLRGYYWTPQLQLLLSDYAAGGSLQAKLQEPTLSPPALNWPNRFKIVIGTAKGLSHLHHSFQSPIIHYNLKPSNILLDEDFNPKISDFGLARLLTKLDKHDASSRFQNAPGYVAPELACQSLRVNEKCDVYGFGVLILELVTGKQPGRRSAAGP